MLRVTEIRLPLDHPDEDLPEKIARKLRVPPQQIRSFSVFRRGIDARKKDRIQLVYTLDVEVDDEAKVLRKFKKKGNVVETPDMEYRAPKRASGEPRSRPVVVGAGPCGIFAALLLAEMGLRPVLLERGKSVKERTKDTFGLWRQKKLHPESNVQFGEGGAGTFSDGKLYSQVKDPRHLGRKVLHELVKAGAPEEILWLSKPHIGTFRLVGVVEKLRETIESLGGEIRFETKVVDLKVESDQLRGLELENGETIETDRAVFAVGHSARDTFEVFHRHAVPMEAKPFSIGFRVEHPQSMIDSCRWGDSAGHERLGAADYKLVHHCRNGRSVYSFCMCPGGTVVAATSEPGRVVTNGMSQYSRNERNANSGIVVGISPKDYPGGPLAGVDLQRKLEERAFDLGGRDYSAPAQLVGDFLAGRPSKELGEVNPSYTPGIKLCDLQTALPSYAIEAIREAIPAFDAKIPGFSSPDALLTAVETRTSSPVKILRAEDLQSPGLRGFFPAGEGAGFAGGILSAAIDGIRCAEAVAVSY